MDTAVSYPRVYSVAPAPADGALAARGTRWKAEGQRTPKAERRAKGLGARKLRGCRGLLLLLTLLLGACAGGRLTTREKGALFGGGLGAGAGALIGGGKGAAIGGALGALSGGLIGDQLQGQQYRQAGQQRQINRQQREVNRQSRELRALRRRQEQEEEY